MAATLQLATVATRFPIKMVKSKKAQRQKQPSSSNNNTQYDDESSSGAADRTNGPSHNSAAAAKSVKVKGEDLIHVSPSRVRCIILYHIGTMYLSSIHNNNMGSSCTYYFFHVQVRFQHSRIRPSFSGCGRSVMETLEEIRRGSLDPADLPPIQVRKSLYYFVSLNAVPGVGVMRRGRSRYRKSRDWMH